MDIYTLQNANYLFISVFCLRQRQQKYHIRYMRMSCRVHSIPNIGITEVPNDVFERLEKTFLKIGEPNAANPRNESSPHGNAQSVQRANIQVERLSLTWNDTIKFVLDDLFKRLTKGGLMESYQQLPLSSNQKRFYSLIIRQVRQPSQRPMSFQLTQ